MDNKKENAHKSWIKKHWKVIFVLKLNLIVVSFRIIDTVYVLKELERPKTLIYVEIFFLFIWLVIMGRLLIKDFRSLKKGNQN